MAQNISPFGAFAEGLAGGLNRAASSYARGQLIKSRLERERLENEQLQREAEEAEIGRKIQEEEIAAFQRWFGETQEDRGQRPIMPSAQTPLQAAAAGWTRLTPGTDMAAAPAGPLQQAAQGWATGMPSGETRAPETSGLQQISRGWTKPPDPNKGIKAAVGFLRDRIKIRMDHGRFDEANKLMDQNLAHIQVLAETAGPEAAKEEWNRGPWGERYGQIDNIIQKGRIMEVQIGRQVIKVNPDGTREVIHEGEPSRPKMTGNIVVDKTSPTGYSYADEYGDPIPGATAPVEKTTKGEGKGKEDRAVSLGVSKAINEIISGDPDVPEEACGFISELAEGFMHNKRMGLIEAINTAKREYKKRWTAVQKGASAAKKLSEVVKQIPTPEGQDAYLKSPAVKKYMSDYGITRKDVETLIAPGKARAGLPKRGESKATTTRPTLTVVMPKKQKQETALERANREAAEKMRSGIGGAIGAVGGAVKKGLTRRLLTSEQLTELKRQYPKDWPKIKKQYENREIELNFKAE